MADKPKRRFLSLSLPAWVLIGAVGGIMAGIFFGSYCATLEWIGSAYVMLLQAVVYPYIICSLIHGLGQLSPERALRLFKRGWIFFVVAWVATFGAIYLLSSAIPAVPSPVVLDPAAGGGAGAGLLQLLIPANPFQDLTQNYVPAVVVFSILFGIAIQKFEKKEGMLQILSLVRLASVRIWGWIVRLAPFAVFALFANTAGTIKVPELESLLIYLGLFLGGTFILAFWVAPAVISALAPIRYREVLRDLQAGIVLAAVTTLSVVALPCIQEAARKLADRCRIEDTDCDDIIQTTSSVSYPLGQLGNFFVCLFILFAAFYFKVSLPRIKAIELPFMTLLSCIGSPSSTVNAVEFFGSWLRMPAGTTEMYVETMVITRYGQVLLSVMGFAFLTFLVTLSYYGKLQLRPKKLIGTLLLSLLLLSGVAAAGRVYRRVLPARVADRYLLFPPSAGVTAGVDAVLRRGADEAGAKGAPKDVRPGEVTLHRIQRTRTLRVGYNGNVIPFSYFNLKKQLVGYDIAFAYDLARSLNAKLEFIPFEWQELQDDLKAARFDIAMAGIYVTEDRLQNLKASQAYFQSPVALIVPSRNANRFLRMDDIRSIEDLKVATFDDPVLLPLLRRLLPEAEVAILPDYEALPERPDIDAAIWTLEQASSWARAHPGFTAVKPTDLGGIFTFAYLMPPDSPELLRFVNHWLALREADGFKKTQHDYWILGQPQADPAQRWSIIRDVLHWVK